MSNNSSTSGSLLKITTEKYEHHFEVDGAVARYKRTIDLKHGELIRADITDEVREILRTEHGLEKVSNTF